MDNSGADQVKNELCKILPGGLNKSNNKPMSQAKEEREAKEIYVLQERARQKYEQFRGSQKERSRTSQRSSEESDTVLLTTT